MRRVRNHWVALFTAAVLFSCGGGGSSGEGNSGSGAGASSTGAGTGTSAPMPGTLLQNPPRLMSTVTAVSLLAELTHSSNQQFGQFQQIVNLVGAPVCDIAVYHIEYQTLGSLGEATTASGALMVPVG